MISKLQIVNSMLHDKLYSIFYQYFKTLPLEHNVFCVQYILANVLEVQLNNKFVCHIPIAKQYFNGRQYVDFTITEYLQDSKIICYNENTNINILLCCIDYVYDNIFKLSEIFESNIRENIEVNFELNDECTECVYSKFYDNVLQSI